MTISTNSTQKSSDCCRHTFWTWLLAALLAIYLFWQWQHSQGLASSSRCCAGAISNVTLPNSPPNPITNASNAFSFTASNAHGYNATGDTSNVVWATKALELKNWFKGGTDWVITGDASNITLSGTVDSEEIKKAKGAEAQAFFGDGITIDNQLSVKVSESSSTASAPAAAKIYFDTGKTSLPSDANQNLSEIIAWLKANPTTKAVISGYSDPRGNHDKNSELSKNRAKAVREMLTNAGIEESRIEMRKPEEVESGGDLAEARRVEVSVE